jgi:predicted ATPase
VCFGCFFDVFFDNYEYRALLEPTTKDTLSFEYEMTRRIADPAGVMPGSIQDMARLHDESLFFDQVAQNDDVAENQNVIKNAMINWFVYHFLDTSPESRLKQTHNINDNAFFRPDAANLAAFLYLLRERHTAFYERIVKTIRLVAPFFDDFALRPNPLNEENIRLEWRERGTDEYRDAQMLSDGTLRFICLATLLLQPELPSLILIDEPELGLHPFAIAHLARMLRSASKLTQLIVSTPSAALVNQFDALDIVTVNREEGQSVLKRLDTDMLDLWLDEYGLGDLWEKNVIAAGPQPWIARS